MQSPKFLVVFVLLSAAQSLEMAEAQEGLSVAAKRAIKAPLIDGVFNADEWQGAAIIDSFTQVIPIEGAAPTEKTVVHLMHDPDFLFIAVQCFDSNPQGILAKQMQKEGDTSSDDVINIVIGPFADKRNGYVFSLSAAGAKVDALIDPQRGLIQQWDGLWAGKAQITADGWIAEFAIPFKSFSFDSASTAWGLNIERVIRRKQETVRWSATRANNKFFDLHEAGSVTGIEGLTQGIGLTMEPFGLIAASLNDGTTTFQPGFNMAYQLTPSTTAQLTVNTDFAEAEVDQQIVNLSRFPTFFPEKRAFFLQDVSIFSFGGIQESPLPFYSRRIGIVRGQKKDIFAGMKITGREGIFNFGVLDVQMYDDPDLGAKNLAAARIIANLFDQSSAGIIITHGDPGTTGSNTVVGGDFLYRNSHIFGDQVLQARGFVMGSFSAQGPPSLNVPSGSDQDDVAFAGGLSYPNDKISIQLLAGRYGEGFRPALGFVQRPGSWELVANTHYRWRTNGYLRRIDLAPRLFVFLNLDGSLQSLTGRLPEIQLENSDGDALSLNYVLRREALIEPFAVSSAVAIPAGTYPYNIFAVHFDSSPKRIVSVSSGIGVGSFYTGTFMDPYIGLDFRPSRHFLFGGYYQFIKYSLAQGTVITQVARGNANLIISPTLTWNNLVQYDTRSNIANISSIMRYEVMPGQTAFLVINQGIGISDGFVLEARKGEVSLKLGMTLVF